MRTANSLPRAKELWRNHLVRHLKERGADSGIADLRAEYMRERKRMKSAARNRAKTRLVKLHRDEFRKLLREESLKAGIAPLSEEQERAKLAGYLERSYEDAPDPMAKPSGD